MVFTSFNFLIFFPIVAILFYITPIKLRWLTLLLASYFFYININPVFALFVAGDTLCAYFFTRLMDKTHEESRKKVLMQTNIILVLLPLLFFKYFGQVNRDIFTLLQVLNIRWPLPEIKLLLPVGISFYTFTAIGYIVDVYKEEIKSEKNLGILALFFSFFPLILSGPIERAKNMLHQFKAENLINYSMITSGLKLMLWGYFMKLVVADRLGIYVDAAFGNISQHNGATLLLASIMNPLQLYADFGGYSLIAIGTARVMGINVMQNFRRPFFAASMAEFWRRWHISLISWITDYIYTPLSFTYRKFKIWGVVIGLMVAFMISGLWHGAALTFVVWGLMQGTFLSIEALTNKRKTLFERKHDLNKKKWYTLAGMVLTFILFSSSEIFVRSATIGDSMQIYNKIFTDLFHFPYKDGSTMLYGFLGFNILLCKDFIDEFYPNRILFFENRNTPIRWLSYYITIFLIFYLGVFGQEKFIYFQY